MAAQRLALAEAILFIPEERYRRLLRLRLGVRGDSLTYAEIGIVMGISRQRAHQLTRVAVEMLWERVADRQVAQLGRGQEGEGEYDAKGSAAPAR